MDWRVVVPPTPTAYKPKGKGDDVAFSAKEIQFYAVCFIAAGIACLARVWRDNEHIDVRTCIGRCVSSGVLGFGTIGLWIGRSADSISGSSFYYLAAATLVGYVGKDLQDQLLNRIIRYGLQKTGLDEKQAKDEPEDKQGNNP